MKNIKIKNLGCGVLCSCLLSFSAQAQTCQAAPSCQDLGFNKTAAECAGISSLKCPLDENYMFCPGNGWIFDFIGTGEPQVGSIVYSDGTINTALVQNKTPIAVVFDVENQLAVALASGNNLWMKEIFDVPANPNLSIEDAPKDMDGRKNTLTISEFCKAKGISCPAVEFALNYVAGKKTCPDGSISWRQGDYGSGTWNKDCEFEGAGAGQWFLPSAGQLISLAKNRNIVSPVLATIAPNSLRLFDYPDEGYWSSTEVSSSIATLAEGYVHCISRSSVPSLQQAQMANVGLPDGCEKKDNNSIRPIMHFELKK